MPRSRRPARSTRSSGKTHGPRLSLRFSAQRPQQRRVQQDATFAPRPELAGEPRPLGRVQVQAGDLVLVLVGHQLVQPAGVGRATACAAAGRASIPATRRRVGVALRRSSRSGRRPGRGTRSARAAARSSPLAAARVEELRAPEPVGSGPPARGRRQRLAAGSTTAARPQRKAARLVSTAAPFELDRVLDRAARRAAGSRAGRRRRPEHVRGHVVAEQPLASEPGRRGRRCSAPGRASMRGAAPGRAAGSPARGVGDHRRGRRLRRC